MAKDRKEPAKGKSGGDRPKGSGKGAATPPTGKPSVVKATKQNNQRFYGLLGLVALVGAVFIGYQMTRPKAGPVTIDPNTPLPKAEGYVIGNPSAPVQVIEFADFECPACGNFATITEPDVRKRLVETGQISIRFIDFPLPGHPNTWEASNAAACANEQGKFWEMHDQIFANQDRWNGVATSRPKSELQRLAKAAGVDESKWESCYDARKYNLNIVAHQKEGERRLVGQTPTFIIGSKMLPGSLSYDAFKAYVDTALATAKPAVADSSKPAAK
ncbi:MAG: thioredoxin domain-containing protein [Gemmatimonadaceae bacterium]